MHTIRPLQSLTDAEVRQLGHVAADCGDPPDSNPFTSGTDQHALFAGAYLAREQELSACAA